MSWNKIYSTQRYFYRKILVDQIHKQVLYALISQKIARFPFKGRVDVVIDAYFKSRPLDPDNIPAKIFIDGAKDYLFKDDTMRFVRKVTTESHIDKPGEERVELTFVEIVEDL